MYAGIIYSKKENNFSRHKILIGLAFIGFTIQYIEAELFLTLFNYKKYTHQFLIGTTVVAISLFVISSTLNLRDNIFSKWGKEHSLFIYLYHPLINAIPLVILNKLTPTYYDFIKIFFPLIGFTLTLAFSIVLSRFLPKLYSIMNGRLETPTTGNRVDRPAN